LVGGVKIARDRKPLGVRTVVMCMVIFCMYNFVYIFLAIIMKVVFWLECLAECLKRVNKKWGKSVVAVARLGDE
jgi:hypothetical protein